MRSTIVHTPPGPQVVMNRPALLMPSRVHPCPLRPSQSQFREALASDAEKICLARAPWPGHRSRSARSANVLAWRGRLEPVKETEERQRMKLDILRILAWGVISAGTVYGASK